MTPLYTNLNDRGWHAAIGSTNKNANIGIIQSDS